MEQVISKDGTVIACQKSGAGRPLLLVHGTTADHNRWAGILPHLAQQFTVYAMDRRGRGGSGDASAYDFQREVEDVVAVVAAIGEATAVLGHSFGALCSLEAALLTDSIQQLILYEPPIPEIGPPVPPGVPQRMQVLIDDGEQEAALVLFLREVVRMPDHVLVKYRHQPAWPTRVQLAATVPRELTLDQTYRFHKEKFATVNVPTLLLVGGDSPPFARQVAERLDEALPNGRIATMPGQQHIAMDTNPELFLSEVMRFLDQ